MTSAGIMSFFGKSKPYDAQVEYLRPVEATASIFSTDFRIDDNDWVIEWDGSWFSTADWQGVFTAYTNETSESTRVLTHYQSGKSLYAGYRRQANAQTRCDLADGNAITERNRIRLSYMKLEVYRYSTGATQTFTLQAPSGTTQQNQVLRLSMAKGRGRLYGFKVWHSGQLMMDLVPVRIGAEPCLYDAVTKTTKRLTESQRQYVLPGPDIVPVEYIQSTGTQWIDTGIILSSSNKVICRGSMTSVSSGSSEYFFGAYGNGSNFGINQVANGSDNTGDLYYVWKSNSTKFGEITSGELVSLELSLDGVKLNGMTLAVPTGTFTGDRTCYVFWANGTGQGKAIGKIYSLQIYDGAALVRDYIPVRVGTQGAMYDKLTRVVYRNAGTGSFIVGKDLAQRPQVRPSEVGGYAQDGLVGMWDAKENNGVGSNSSRTTAWKNLGSLGSAYDFTLDDECYWTPNAMVVNSYTAHATSPMIPRDQIKTMEIVFRPRVSYNVTTDNSRIRAFTFGDRLYTGTYYTTRRMLAWNANNGHRGWMFATGNALPSGQSGTSMPVGPDVRTFSVVYPAANDTDYLTTSTPVRVMRYGTQWNVSSWLNEGDACQQVQTIGNPRGADGGAFARQGIIMEVFCVRLYNRQLTVEEQNANHALDVQRFG